MAGMVIAMPRQSHIDEPRALHHVIIQGIESKSIFRDDADGTEFIDRIESTFPDSYTPCFAWVLREKTGSCDYTR